MDRVGNKSLELLRTRLLDAVKKESAALLAEDFGSPEDIDRNFKSLFQAELGPNELGDPDQTTGGIQKKSTYDVFGRHLSNSFDFQRAIGLAKPAYDGLVGTWRIMEFSMVDKVNRNEKVYPWGPLIDGMMIFTPDGYISGQVIIPGQATFGGSEPWTAGTAELAESARRSCSYSGRFSVERTAIGPTLAYDLEFCNYPGFRDIKYRVFLDLIKKDNQQFLITTLTCNEEVRQKQEVWRKV